MSKGYRRTGRMPIGASTYILLFRKRKTPRLSRQGVLVRITRSENRHLLLPA